MPQFSSESAAEVELEWGQTWPLLGEFREIGEQRRVVPVVRKLLADELTPVGIYRTLAQGRPGTFILESAESDGTWSRYSFVGVNSRATLTSQDGVAKWTGDVPVGIPDEGNPIEVLDATLKALQCPPVPGLPPLTGGMVGAVGWEAISYWEPTLMATKPDELQVPDLALCLVSDLVAIDHYEGTIWLIASAINFDNTSARVDQAHADALRRLDNMQEALFGSRTQVGVGLSTSAVPDVAFRTTQEDYEASVLAGQQAISDGEVFQVVLSQRFDLDCTVAAIDVYRVLRTVNPSPYMYLVNLQTHQGVDFAVVGSSPETLVRVNNREVMTFPIAGSRPRGKDSDQDAELSAELIDDPKERAEHLMLVDLSRNDLGKVCDPATVDVVDFMAIKKFSHVMHICSTVVGTLRPESTALDTFTAAFPAGTLSGAPKPRAVALIDELEPARRGVYGGTVGYFDFHGNLDMAIAIRTALIKEGKAHVQAGAGIVAASVPTSEYEECRNKAAAVVHAIQLAHRLH